MAIKKFKVTASAKAKRAVNAGMTYKVGRTYNTDHSEGPYAVYEINEDMSSKGWTSFDGKSTVGKAEIRQMLNGKEFPNSIEGTFEEAVELAKRYNEDEAADRVWDLQHGDVNSACGKKSIKSFTKRKPMKKTVKASASAKRRMSKKAIKASTLKQQIYEFLDDLGMYADYNQKIEDLVEAFGITPELAESYVWDWSSGLNNVYSSTKKSVKASVSAKRGASKKCIKASKEDALERAKRNIYESYVYSDYGSDISFEDYFKNEDLHNVGLLYTTIGDDEYDFQVSADLIDPKVTVSVGDKVVYEDKYSSIDALADDLEDFDWDEWYSFYLHKLPDEYDEVIYGACKNMNKKIKASASAKRRASKRPIKAYIEEYPNWVYDWTDKKTEQNKRKYDEKLNEWYDAAESMYPEFYSLKGADRKAAIEEVNKAVGFTMDDVFSSTSVKASIDSDYDTKVLRELEDYIKDNYPIYVDTEYAVYEDENDWSVGLFATLGMVESDFEYYLNEQNPYLYNRLTETGLIGGPSVNNAVGANDFQFQLYPAQDQWRGPQLDIDETNLANAGDDGSVYAELKTQIDAFEIMYINALQELNYHMGDLLREYDEGQGIHASTDVNADLQLNKYPDDRNKYSYNKNSITDIDGYVQDIADGVVEKFPDLEYEISDEAITFTRDGNVIYVQAIDEIVPERDDLDDDIDELASAIQMDDELNAMREDFDAGWNATYDSDTATRAVEMSVDEDLEPIMGDDFEEEDMGFGFTTSGEAISESMVDELCRIANEILEKSELAKYDEYTSIDRDTFDYWCDGSTYVSEKFYIYFTFTQNGGWFINNNMVDFSDSRGISETEDFTFECDIYIKDGEVVEVLYNDMPDNYSADMIDVPALTEYIEKLATPVARDIYNGTTNI